MNVGVDRRITAQVVAVGWALVGGGIAVAAFGDVNADARVLVGAFTVLGPLAALAAAALIHRGADRKAGAALLVSVLTPTYFAAALNLVPLALGLLLVAHPGFLRSAPSANVATGPRP